MVARSCAETPRTLHGREGNRPCNRAIHQRPPCVRRDEGFGQVRAARSGLRLYGGLPLRPSTLSARRGGRPRGGTLWVPRPLVASMALPDKLGKHSALAREHDAVGNGGKRHIDTFVLLDLFVECAQGRRIAVVCRRISNSAAP